MRAAYKIVLATKSVCMYTDVALVLCTLAANAQLSFRVCCLHALLCYCIDTTDTTAAVTSATSFAATYEGTYDDAIRHIVCQNVNHKL
jgi:hypothetical protein